MVLTTEEFLQDSLSISHFYDDRTNQMVVPDKQVKQAMIEFAKLHVQAALKAAVDQADTLDFDNDMGEIVSVIQEDSILNAYPLENIK